MTITTQQLNQFNNSSGYGTYVSRIPTARNPRHDILSVQRGNTTCFSKNRLNVKIECCEPVGCLMEKISATTRSSNLKFG